jgi:hypothetical protein
MWEAVVLPQHAEEAQQDWGVPLKEQGMRRSDACW